MRLNFEWNETPGRIDGEEKAMADHTDAAHVRLHEILLNQLRLIDAHFWPGADGLTIDAVLAGYTEAAAAGQVPGLAQLTGTYPELTVELEEVFAHPSERASAPTGLSPGMSIESEPPYRLD
jgi:hypothetical protein